MKGGAHDVVRRVGEKIICFSIYERQDDAIWARICCRLVVYFMNPSCFVYTLSIVLLARSDRSFRVNIFTGFDRSVVPYQGPIHSATQRMLNPRRSHHCSEVSDRDCDFKAYDLPLQASLIDAVDWLLNHAASFVPAALALELWL